MLERLESLLGKENLEKIKNKNVLLIGLGGVGGFTLEALVRSGITNITVVDGDKFQESNLNRQILANNYTIGENKVDIAIKRAKEINENINITGINSYIDDKNIKEIGSFDYIIDACDDCNAKKELIKYANENNIKIISSMGTGKRMNPKYVKITRLDKTFNDPLAKKMRTILKKENISLKIPVVYSEESPLNNEETISSSIFVPSVAGIYLAYYVINDILNN